MNTLQEARQRVLHLLEHLESDTSKNKSTTAAVASANASGGKPKLADVFDLGWVKATAEQEQKTRRRSSAGGSDVKVEPDSPQQSSMQRQSSIPVAYDQESQGDEQDGEDMMDDQNKDSANSHGKFRKRKRPAQLRTSTGGSSEPETETGSSMANIIRSLDEPDHDLESKIKSESSFDDSTHGNTGMDRAATGGSSMAGSGGKTKTDPSSGMPSTSKKTSTAKASLSTKTKTIPLESDPATRPSDPRTNPPNLDCVRDLPLPNFYKRLVRHGHHAIGATSAGGGDSQHGQKEHGAVKTDVKAEVSTDSSVEEAHAAARTRQVRMGTHTQWDGHTGTEGGAMWSGRMDGYLGTTRV